MVVKQTLGSRRVESERKSCVEEDKMILGERERLREREREREREKCI
jgi:hypothetical protein